MSSKVLIETHLVLSKKNLQFISGMMSKVLTTLDISLYMCIGKYIELLSVPNYYFCAECVISHSA